MGTLKILQFILAFVLHLASANADDSFITDSITKLQRAQMGFTFAPSEVEVQALQKSFNHISQNKPEAHKLWQFVGALIMPTVEGAKGYEGFSTLADHIIKSGYDRDNSVLRTLGFAWAANKKMNQPEQDILDARFYKALANTDGTPSGMSITNVPFAPDAVWQSWQARHQSISAKDALTQLYICLGLKPLTPSHETSHTQSTSTPSGDAASPLSRHSSSNLDARDEDTDEGLLDEPEEAQGATAEPNETGSNTHSISAATSDEEEEEGEKEETNSTTSTARSGTPQAATKTATPATSRAPSMRAASSVGQLSREPSQANADSLGISSDEEEAEEPDASVNSSDSATNQRPKNSANTVPGTPTSTSPQGNATLLASPTQATNGAETPAAKDDEKPETLETPQSTDEHRSDQSSAGSSAPAFSESDEERPDDESNQHNSSPTKPSQQATQPTHTTQQDDGNSAAEADPRRHINTGTEADVTAAINRAAARGAVLKRIKQLISELEAIPSQHTNPQQAKTYLPQLENLKTNFERFNSNPHLNEALHNSALQHQVAAVETKVGVITGIITRHTRGELNKLIRRIQASQPMSYHPKKGTLQEIKKGLLELQDLLNGVLNVEHELSKNVTDQISIVDSELSTMDIPSPARGHDSSAAHSAAIRLDQRPPPKAKSSDCPC